MCIRDRYQKKTKKRQPKTPLLKKRSTPIALAALRADFSIFSVPPLCQFSFEKPMIFCSLVQIFDVLSENNWFSYIIIEILKFPMKNEWFVKILVQICNFRVSDSDLHFRDAEHPSKWPPGHSWLQKCICEERLSIENVTFWAPCIFQKFRVPDLRLSDSIDSRSHLIPYPQTVCKGLQC